MDNPQAFPSIRFEKKNRVLGIFYNGKYIGDFINWECDPDREPIMESKQFIYTCENLKQIINDNVIDIMKFMDKARADRSGG